MAEGDLATLRIAIEASLKDFSSKMGEFEDVLKGTEQATQVTKNSFGELAGSFATGQFAVDAARQAFQELKVVFIASAAAADKHLVTMEQLKTSMGFGSEAINKFAQEQEKSTRFSKEDTLSAANALTIHKLNREEMERLLPVIEDFAAKKGVSATETAEAFGRAIEYGTTRGLRPFGIEVEKNGSQMDIFNELLAAGDGKVKGLAERMGALGEGPLFILQNRLKTLGEQFGEKIIPALDDIVSRVGPPLLSFLEKLVNFTDTLVKNLPNIARLLAAMVTGNVATVIQTIASEVNEANAPKGAGFGFKSPGAMPELGEGMGGFTHGSIGVSGDQSALSTTSTGAKDKSGEEFWKKQHEAILSNLEVYKSKVEETMAELDVSLKNSEVGLNDWYVKSSELISKSADEQIAVQKEIIRTTNDATEKTKAKNAIELINVETTKKMVELGEKYVEQQKKQAELNEKVASLKTMMGVQQEGVAEAGEKDPTKKLEQTQAKELATMKKTIDEYLAAAKKAGTSEVEIEKETSKQKMAIRQKEQQDSIALENARQEANLSLAKDTASSLSTLANDMYEATGKKNRALWEVSKQASALSALINGALGFTKCIADMGMPWGGILGALALGIGIAEAAIIEQKQYPKAETGGIIAGPAHVQGGVNINMEGGEAAINRAAVNKYGPSAIHAINAGTAAISLRGAPGSAGTPGAAVGATVHITNLQDPRMIDRHMATAEGKQSYLNFLGQNKTAVRAKLGV